MTEAEFRELLQRFKEGNCSREELKQINLWFESIADEELELTELEKSEARNKMWANMQTHLPRKSFMKRNIGVMMKVAASVAVILLAGYIFTRIPTRSLSSHSSGTSITGTVKEVENFSGKVLVHVLPDGSSVELQPESRIFYAAAWGRQTREVHLVGEAFFRVVENPNKPFFVYGGEVITKVLGTSFRVKAPESAERIEVEVKTGKVSVYEDRSQRGAGTLSETSGVILTPNEKVRYYVKDRHWVTSLVERPQPLSTGKEMKATFVFSGTPVQDVFKHIEAGYDIDIIIENEDAYACTFTGDVSRMELYNMLQVICRSIGAHYEVKGTKILISGTGCTQNSNIET